MQVGLQLPMEAGESLELELNSAEIKMQKPSDTRWLLRERAVRRSIPALVNTFEAIYNDTGDAEVHGIATLACIYMLSDVLHTVAKLQGRARTLTWPVFLQWLKAPQNG